jgi:hypothetical protein
MAVFAEGMEYSSIQGFLRSPIFFFGPQYSDTEQELILQANKNAENAEVKKSAQKDGHGTLTKCAIDPNKVDA